MVSFKLRPLDPYQKVPITRLTGPQSRCSCFEEEEIHFPPTGNRERFLLCRDSSFFPKFNVIGKRILMVGTTGFHLASSM